MGSVIKMKVLTVRDQVDWSPHLGNRCVCQTDWRDSMRGSRVDKPNEQLLRCYDCLMAVYEAQQGFEVDFHPLHELWGSPSGLEHWYDGTETEAILRRTCLKYYSTKNNLWNTLRLLLDTTPGERFIGDCPDTDPRAGEIAIRLIEHQQCEFMKKAKQEPGFFGSHSHGTSGGNDSGEFLSTPFEVADTVFLAAIANVVDDLRRSWHSQHASRLAGELLANSQIAGYPLTTDEAENRISESAAEWCKRLEPHAVLRKRKDLDRGAWQVLEVPVSEDAAVSWWLWHAHYRYASDLAAAGKGSDGALFEAAVQGAMRIVLHDRDGGALAEGSKPHDPVAVARGLVERGLEAAQATASNDAVRPFQCQQWPPPDVYNFVDGSPSQFGVLFGKMAGSRALRQAQMEGNRLPSFPLLRNLYYGRNDLKVTAAGLDEGIEFETREAAESDKRFSELHNDIAELHPTGQNDALWEWAYTYGQYEPHDRAFKFQRKWFRTVTSVLGHLPGMTVDQALAEANREEGAEGSKDLPAVRRLRRFMKAFKELQYICCALADDSYLVDVETVDNAVKLLDRFPPKSGIVMILRAASTVGIVNEADAIKGTADFPYANSIVRVPKVVFARLVKTPPASSARRTGPGRLHGDILTLTDLREAAFRARLSTVRLRNADPSEFETGCAVEVLHHAEHDVASVLGRSDPTCVEDSECVVQDWTKRMKDVLIQNNEVAALMKKEAQHHAQA